MINPQILLMPQQSAGRLLGIIYLRLTLKLQFIHVELLHFVVQRSANDFTLKNFTPLLDFCPNLALR